MKYFVYIIIAIVAAAIVTGFFVVGSPREERMRRFDAERVQHLQMIQGYIGEYYRAKTKIPNTLNELNDQFRGVIVPQDPETSTSYEYQKSEDLKFTLCAVFNRASIGQTENKYRPVVPFGGPFGADTWEHVEGRVCFERTIDKDFFTPISKPR